MDYSDKVVCLQTNNIKIFKIIFEILKDILPETNITFYKETDNDGETVCGFKISDMTETICISLKIITDMSSFYCSKNKYTVGINLKYLADFFKSAEDSDNLTLFVNNSDTQLLQIETITNNKAKKMSYTLTTIDVPLKQINSEIRYQVHVLFSTEDFHKLCRDMKKIGTVLEITCTNRTIIFECKQGMHSSSKVSFTHTENSDSKVKIEFMNISKDTIIRNSYDLKHLLLFSKCSGFCPKLDMYLNSEIYPLCLNYNIGETGHLKALITPLTQSPVTTSNTDEIEY